MKKDLGDLVKTPAVNTANHCKHLVLDCRPQLEGVSPGTAEQL